MFLNRSTIDYMLYGAIWIGLAILSKDWRGGNKMGKRLFIKLRIMS